MSPQLNFIFSLNQRHMNNDLIFLHFRPWPLTFEPPPRSRQLSKPSPDGQLHETAGGNRHPLLSNWLLDPFQMPTVSPPPSLGLTLPPLPHLESASGPAPNGLLLALTLAASVSWTYDHAAAVVAGLTFGPQAYWSTGWVVGGGVLLSNYDPRQAQRCLSMMGALWGPLGGSWGK